MEEMPTESAVAAAERWARGKGLIALLATLSPQYDHILQGKATEVTPIDSSDTEVTRAYRQTMLLLHPDRKAQRGEEVTEDEAEVLKVLTEAHADTVGWYDGLVRPKNDAAPALSSEPTRWAKKASQASADGQEQEARKAKAKAAEPLFDPDNWVPSSAGEKAWDTSRWQAPDLKTMHAARKAAASGAASSGSADAGAAPATSTASEPFSSAPRESAYNPRPAYKGSASGGIADGLNAFSQPSGAPSTQYKGAAGGGLGGGLASLSAKGGGTKPAVAAMSAKPAVATTRSKYEPAIVAGGSSKHVAPIIAGASSRKEPAIVAGAKSKHVAPIIAGASSRHEPAIVAGAKSKHVAPIIAGASSRHEPAIVAGAKSKHVAPIIAGASSRHEPAIVAGSSSASGLAANTSLMRGNSSKAGLASGLQSCVSSGPKATVPESCKERTSPSHSPLADSTDGILLEPSAMGASASGGLAAGTSISRGSSSAAGLGSGLKSLSGSTSARGITDGLSSLSSKGRGAGSSITEGTVPQASGNASAGGGATAPKKSWRSWLLGR